MNKVKTFICLIYNFYIVTHYIHTLLLEIKYKNIYEEFIKKYGGQKVFFIGIEHGSPFALYIANKYSKSKGVVCFPLRSYNKEGLERRIYKMKDKKGWDNYISKEYDIENYFINPKNEHLQEILSKKENYIAFMIMELQLRKQYDKIPTLFSCSTVIYTRLDLDQDSFVGRNLKKW